MRQLTALALFSVALIAQPAPPKPAAAGQLQIGAWKNLKFGKLAEVKIPEIDQFTLKNGIRVYLLENHALPFISGSVLVRTGSLLDPPGKSGMTNIAATVLRSGGTRAKTGDQIDEQLENIAASVESGIGAEVATLSFNCLKENVDEVMGVFYQVLTEPEFRQDKIDLEKRQYRSLISRRYDDADEVNNTEFSRIVYGRDTPFGQDVEYETIDAITRQDLIDFHKRYYHPGNVTLTVSGDFDKAAMRARLEQVFGNWTAAGGAKAEFPKVTHKASPGIYLGEKKDVTQTFVSIGHLGGLYNDRDYPALEVLSSILGGGFDSRLFRKVRTEQGYAYNVGGGWGADYLHPGLFRIVASTKAESTTETIQLILKEIERVRAEPVTDLELNTAKDKVMNGFVFNFDRPQKTLSRLVRYDYYGYPKDFLTQYQKAIAAVTKADVLRVAKQHLDPARFVITAIGNPDSFKTPLSDLKMPITKLDLKVKEPAKPAAQSSEASLTKGKQLLQRMQKATGGVDKLAAIKDMITTGSAALGPMVAKQKTWTIVGTALRQEQDLPFGRVVVRWDGQTGTLTAPNAPAPQPLTPPIQKQIREESFRNLISLLLSDQKPDRSVNAVSDHEIEISDKEGNSAKVAVDAQSGLPAKLTYQAVGPQGPAETEVHFKGWKEVSGVQFPHALEILQGGKKASEVKFETVVFNVGVTVTEIMKP